MTRAHERTPMTARQLAYQAAALGLGVSITANILHATIEAAPGKTVLSWVLFLFALVMSAFWPIALFYGVELLIRVEWGAAVPDIAPVNDGRLARAVAGVRRTLLMAAARLAVATVAAVAAVISYQHLSDLMVTAFGESVLSSRIGPIGVDGLMTVAAAAMWATGRAQARTALQSVTAPAAVEGTEPAQVTTPAPESPAGPAPTDGPDRLPRPGRRPPRPQPRRPATSPIGVQKVPPAEIRRLWANRAPGTTQASLAEQLGIAVRTLQRALNDEPEPAPASASAPDPEPSPHLAAVPTGREEHTA